MKNTCLLLAVLLFFCILLLPLIALPGVSAPEAPDASSWQASDLSPDQFLVKLHETDEIVEMQANEYIFGVLAAEISPTYHEEAVKAQVVAAYTFASRKRNIRLSQGGDYDITTDSSVDQGFCSRETVMQKWGEQAEAYAAAFDNAIAAVAGYVITFEKQPILASYHAVSSGKTESAANVWGSDYPYLQPVESIGDLLSPDYLSEQKFGKADFIKIAAALGANVEGDPNSLVSEPVRSQSGTVLRVTIGGKELTGAQVRQAFSLRSANFDLAFADDTFTFTVRGYGHLVGMSQYGANYMAQQGSTFLEILSWYYQGCQLEKYN